MVEVFSLLLAVTGMTSSVVLATLAASTGPEQSGGVEDGVIVAGDEIVGQVGAVVEDQAESWVRWVQL